MCGVAGFLCRGGNVEQQRDIVQNMVQAIRNRGPDDTGYWIADDGSVALGHARLSVQDLSENGAQPMRSASGRFVISYNGEVYNFPVLMKELQALGHRFRGHSDTEVMLAAIEEWGLKNALARFIGMFAFALLDNDARTLSLVRDRVGIKPLFYQEKDGFLIFGSELKSIRAFQHTRPGVDRQALALFLQHSYVPAPHTIYEGVKKLPPGCILTAAVDRSGKLRTDIATFWSIENLVAGDASKFSGSYGEAVDQLHDLLSDAVSQCLISDVPLGGFLSGGIDSSVVVSLMQRQSNRPVRTFSIGFAEDSHNEAPWAKKVAAHLRTEHHELIVSPDDVRSVIPELASIYDEPFADSSQIPTILISRLAREHVTVSLSGDGGDELFSGYKRYDATMATWRSIGWLPSVVRSTLSALLGGVADVFTTIADPVFGKIYDRFGVAGNRGNELRRAAMVLRTANREDLYRYMMSHWKDGAALVKGVAGEAQSLLAAPPGWLIDRHFRDYMMLADTCTYLPDDILTKVDRASMSCSLEVRVPLLDHRVVEFAMGLPLGYKREGGRSKAPLRDVLGKYVPAELIERPKMGFSIPINDWLRGPLQDWGFELLSKDRILRDGYFDPQPILEKWNEHQSGHRNWAGYLWDVLMFQSWLDEQT